MGTTAQNLTTEKKNHADDVSFANDQIGKANAYAESVNNAVKDASSAQTAASIATDEATKANSATTTSNVNQ
ncbi:hypothetical protein FM131_04500 [Weissella confusa]|nr:hypothetical protein FM131_04500 [Weissella confusa]